MKIEDRRDFLKSAGKSALGLAGGSIFLSCDLGSHKKSTSEKVAITNTDIDKMDTSIIGIYGKWANSLLKDGLPSHSFRRKEWKDLKTWQKSAKEFLLERMAIPDIGGVPEVTVKKQYNYDGLHIEELSWQLPYGRPTKALLLKPIHAKGRLPGVLAFYDHGLQKYYGVEKITRTSDHMDPIIVAHQKTFYEGKAWANEIAKRGYVVLVPDVFPFGSRRMMIDNIPEAEIQNIEPGVQFKDPQGSANYIKNYNLWAAEEEHVIAKSLFCAGTTWPAVFFGEDRISLDILCAREDVDASRIGCGGLSGGGCRTNFMAGLDSRIKCAASVAFQTTWEDFIMNKSYTHTWMGFVPLLSKGLGYPEILGLRIPLPSFVLNNSNDPLFTLSEQNRANEILEEVYKKAGSDDKYKCSFYPGPHKFDAKMQADAFDWFDKWLKA
jgi:dienelactone hydrolase